MNLKDLLEILPLSLDITIEHDNRKTSSLVCGMLTQDNLLHREVIAAKPDFIHSIRTQSFSVVVK